MLKGKMRVVFLLPKLNLTIFSCLFQDDTDYRGCWKNSRRQQDTYTNTTIFYVDAKVAASMCKSGAITYVVDEESGVTDEWILDHVVPNMVRSGIN